MSSDCLIIVQHCQSEHHVLRSQGVKFTRRQWFDSNLTELGYRQAAAVAQRLASSLGDEPRRVFSSDMPRAAQTAQVIAAALSVSPELREGLREWNALPTPTEQPDPPADPAQPFSLFDWKAFPGGQTWRDFHRLVSECMDALSGGAGGRTIVVTHGGTVSNIVAWWLRLPLDVLPERTPFAGSPGSLTVLKRNAYGNPVIARLNDTTHLELGGLSPAGL